MNVWLRLAMVSLLACAAVTGFAQATNGTLEGQINDEQGQALPGVNVTVQNTATGLQRTVVTDSSGMYRFPGLPVGTYDIKAEVAV